ncbi:MAG: sugar phosphate isomerase/epimerase [Bacteroidales bacterium]|nr:sugar phosphate isomerase/epimerase [Bacteroidales bacterium]
MSLTILPGISAQFTASHSFQLSLGVCTAVDNSSLVKKNHFDFVEETVSSFFIPAESDEKFAENLNKLKQQEIPLYAVNSFLPGTLKCVGPDVNAEAIMSYAATTLKRMDQSNVRILVFGSGGSRKIPDGFDASKARNQFIEINKRIAPLAEKYNVTIVLEPLNYGETNLLNTVEEGIGYVDEINHPNIRLLADIYHMLKNGEPAMSIIKAGKLIRHTHIAEKDQRTAPGVAGDDFRQYFKALETIRFEGKLAIECRWKNMEAELPLAFKTIRNQMENRLNPSY